VLSNLRLGHGLGHEGGAYITSVMRTP